MRRSSIMDHELELIELTRKSINIKHTIDKVKMDTKEYLRSKDLNEYAWELRKEYPGDKHARWVVQQMEKQIDELQLKKDIIDSKIVNWLKTNCEF